LESSTLSAAPYVLILGGSGFIGTRLAARLAARTIPFRIGDLKQSTAYPKHWCSCDVTNLDAVRPLVQPASVVVNLAAEHRDDVRPVALYHAVNVRGAEQVCAAAREGGAQKIVFTSSVAVYGFQPNAVDESGPFEPFNEYGKTKLEAESVYRAWAEEDPTRSLVIIRPTVVFGEGNRGNVFNLLQQIASGRFLMIGQGTNIKSMAYVGNIAEFIAHTLTFGPGVHVANYVDGPDMKTSDLVAHIYRSLGRKSQPRRIPMEIAVAGGRLFDLVGRLSGKKLPISAIRIRKFCETTQFKAERVAQWGFRPPYSLAEGLTRTLEHEFGNQRRA
jgi:GlcNAc-P-P-Und epimerase